MAKEDYIDIRIDVFEHEGQRAKVQKNLTVRALINEVLKEFDDILDDAPERYAIYFKNSEKPLDVSRSITQLDVQPQDELVFDHFQKFIRKMLPEADTAYLVEEQAGLSFEIKWQPAIIGRPSTDINHNIILAVNLQNSPKGKTVSRKHAQITFKDGKYYIEPMVEYNPVFINNKKLPFGKKSEIKSMDKLMIGKEKVTLLFLRDLPDSLSSHISSIAQKTDDIADIAAPESEPFEEATIADGYSIPRLVIEAGTDLSKTGLIIPLETFPLDLGRNHNLLSKENEVSRRHAEVNFNNETSTYTITDLKSTNGVSLNGTKIDPGTPIVFQPGDVIGLGKIVLLKFEE